MMQLSSIPELLATGDASAITEVFADLIGVEPDGTQSSVFRNRAVVLFETATPALVWMRDHRGIPATVEMLCSTLQLRTMWRLATRRVFCLPPDEAGKAVEVLVNDMPEWIVISIRFYLQFMLGLDLTRSEHDNRIGEADRLHGFAMMYSTATSGELLSPKNSQP